jgi:DNA-binding FadR family transcriptional regulator
VHDQDVERVVRTDTEFHSVVVRCAHNALLAELYRGVAEVVARTVATTLPPDLDKPDEISHDGLVEAIEAKDVQRAAREAGDFLTRLLDEH